MYHIWAIPQESLPAKNTDCLTAAKTTGPNKTRFFYQFFHGCPSFMVGFLLFEVRLQLPYGCTVSLQIL
jgi:hypothetical protein